MGAPLSKSASSSRSSLALSAPQRRDLALFVRRTLGSSLHLALRFWIYVTGLEGHEALLRRLFLQVKYRANNAAGFPHAVAMTLVELWLRTLRVVLVPDVFARFLCATFVLHIFYEMKSRARWLLASGVQKLTVRGRRRARLTRMLAQAKSLAERQAIAGELDKIEGKDRWREDPASGLYLYERVINKTQMYKRLQLDSDVPGLMFALRAGLLRKHWGLGNPRLYSVSHVGTKHVIEEYLDTIVQSMNAVLRASSPSPDDDGDEDDELSVDNKLAFFSETRHAFGRSALLLSGGGALGFYHAGVVKALNESNLLPSVIAGSSAGSIVAGIVGVRTDDEVATFFSDSHLDLNFLSVNLTPQDYAQYTPAVVPALQKLLPACVFARVRDALVLAKRYTAKGYLLDGEVLGAALRKYIGDYTFREAYDRTGRIINITVTPLKTDDYPHLLNYLTAPNVLIWSASLASCAIPLVFRPVELLAKDKHGNAVPYFREGLKWSDGSIECDLPMERLSELFNVNHFIVSQVNIHYKVVSGHSAFGFGQTGSLLSFLKKQMKAYIKNIAELGLNTSVLKFLDIGLVPLITQKYEGDITICPTDEFALHYLLRTSLSNPTKDSFREIVAAGERASWPLIARVRTMCRIEFALERAVRYLRGEQAMADERKHGKKAIGRVPSFYTSPSSMNLSSLDQPASSSSSPSSTSGAAARRAFGSEDADDPTVHGSSLRRNRSMNVAGAVMTMESAASRTGSYARFSDMEG